MGGEWVATTLGEVSLDTSYGYTESATQAEVGPHFLRITDIQNGVVDWATVPYCPIDDQKLEKYLLEKGDIVVARTGNSTGENYIFTGQKDTVFASYLIRFKVDQSKADPFYVWYNMRAPKWWEYVNSSKTGSAQAGANAKLLGLFPLVLPSLSEQKKVARILSALDDKIELNRQINATLESMAQALFKSWFVDFDPVIDNALAAGNPIPEPLQARADKRAALLATASAADTRSANATDNAHPTQTAPHTQPGTTAPTIPLQPLPADLRALFPDSFVFNEEMGWVPEGWEIKALDEIANYQNGLALQKFRPEDDSDYLPVVKIAQLKAGFADGEEKASPNIKPECIIDDGDVVFSWSGSLVVDLWCGGKAALNQHLFKVTSENHPRWFYYYFTEHHLAEFQRIAADKAVTMGHIKREHLRQAKCVVPQDSLINALGKFVSPLVDRAVSSRLESRNLASIRDGLLPKLLSGQIQLPEAENLAAEAL